jgi:hypothetical protein
MNANDLKYFGKFNGVNFTVSPTVNRTENSEVKCQVSWDDGGTDFIWFTETEDKLVSQLNPKIFVLKEAIVMNANDLKTVGANKTKMLKQVERMLDIVDQYYGQNLQRELEQLRDALESANEDDISEAISDTIDGCGAATSQLRDLNWALDDFEQAQHDYEQVFRNDIDAFESK